MPTLINNRILYSDNGTISDLSVSLNKFHSSTETTAIVAAEDALYIGSEFPFNHRYIDVDTANSNASTLSVSLWDTSAFVATVETIDQTESSGVSLSQSGIVSWVRDKDESWTRDDTDDLITELSSVTIYDLYWAKLTWSADLSATTKINYVGWKFSDDQDLQARYPLLLDAEQLAAWPETGKQDWNEQHILAAEEIVRDLKRRRVIFSGNQMLDPQLFVDAAIHKTAEIIFSALGDAWENERVKAENKYLKALQKEFNNIDMDGDTRLDLDERLPSIGFFRR